MSRLTAAARGKGEERGTMARTRNPDLEGLVELDGLDRQVQRLRRELTDLPEELAGHEREVRRVEEEIEALRQLSVKTQTDVDRAELDMRANRDQIGKYRGQQNTAKTNEEYNALKSQILALEAKNDQLEDQALASYEKQDDVKAQDKAKRAELAKAQAELAKERGLIEVELAKVKAEVERLEAEREVVKARINPDITKLYERILDKSGGRALARIIGIKCQGCHLDVPSSRVGLAHTGSEVVTCPHCSRILYFDF